MSRSPGPAPSVPDLSAPVLSVADLSCGYGGTAVVAPIGFKLRRGEALVLTGANGTGKSTVLRTAVGQQAPVSGERLLHGGPLVETSMPYRRDVSCLFDEDAFLPGVSVRHHLELVARGHGLPDPVATVQGALQEYGLAGRADASPYDLSSGQRRRALLAAALLRPFALLVLDEPEQRLDSAMRDGLARRLVTARRHGAALLLATHDAALAATVATTVLVLTADGTWERTRPGRIGGGHDG